MAHVSKILFDAYVRARKSDAGESRLAGNSKAAIIAALNYLCDPLDLIPDYTPGIGFVDDAYVLTLCLRRIRKGDRRGFALIERKLRRVLE
jgi:uncharacterized membrane protein YkvA (DUF1232 family)